MIGLVNWLSVGKVEIEIEVNYLTNCFGLLIMNLEYYENCESCSQMLLCCSHKKTKGIGRTYGFHRSMGSCYHSMTLKTLMNCPNAS